MNDRELAKAMRLIAECERRSGGAQPKTIEMLEQGAARLDYLRWHDIHEDGPPPMNCGNWVLVIGEWDGVYEINTPIRSFGGVYEHCYWRRPANPVRRSFGAHKLESEEQDE